MKLSQALLKELEHEAQTTRRHLERLPPDQFDWRPHEKSYTASDLAAHIVECVGWGAKIFNHDEFDIDPATYQPYQPRSAAELLSAFDECVAQCRQALADVDEAALWQPWRLKIRGRARFERPRIEVFRDFTLSHLIHHRGQLSVYLRLLNIPVPGSYGPTADEPG